MVKLQGDQKKRCARDISCDCIQTGRSNEDATIAWMAFRFSNIRFQYKFICTQFNRKQIVAFCDRAQTLYIKHSILGVAKCASNFSASTEREREREPFLQLWSAGLSSTRDGVRKKTQSLVSLSIVSSICLYWVRVSICSKFCFKCHYNKQNKYALKDGHDKRLARN